MNFRSSALSRPAAPSCGGRAPRGRRGAGSRAARARADGDGEIAAVSSTVSPGYSRVKLADGTYQAETYTFGEGGHLAGPPATTRSTS
jgi:hypothetical protein